MSPWSLGPYWDCGLSPHTWMSRTEENRGPLFLGDWSRLCLNLTLDDWSAGRWENEILARNWGVLDHKDVEVDHIQVWWLFDTVSRLCTSSWDCIHKGAPSRLTIWPINCINCGRMPSPISRLGYQVSQVPGHTTLPQISFLASYQMQANSGHINTPLCSVASGRRVEVVWRYSTDLEWQKMLFTNLLEFNRFIHMLGDAQLLLVSLSKEIERMCKGRYILVTWLENWIILTELYSFVIIRFKARW
jgi:hypothetical protein